MVGYGAHATSTPSAYEEMSLSMGITRKDETTFPSEGGGDRSVSESSLG
jgi:hypothetical protein